MWKPRPVLSLQILNWRAAPFDDVIAARTMGSAPTQRSTRGFDELLRGQLDAEQFVEPSPSVGWSLSF